MTPPPPASPAPTTSPTKFHAGGLVNAAVVLGLLYFGREVLVPITLAVILSLLIAPLVRKLRRVVRSQVPAVLEVGPGTSLARLWRERHPSIAVRSCDEFASPREILDWVSRGP